MSVASLFYSSTSQTRNACGLATNKPHHPQRIPQHYTIMKRLVTLLLIWVCTVTAIEAQTFTDHLRRRDTKTHGIVTVTQSATIEQLVNGKGNAGKWANPNPNDRATPSATNGTTNSGSATTSRLPNDKREMEQAHKNDPNKRETTQKNNALGDDGDDLNIPVVDTRKKVMKGGYKIDGYRVQAFAGGNSREDKNRAQQAGNRIKAAYPDQPIYVHFYSPRWICRVGNYRSIEEATRMLSAIQALGYKQAVIVKGKITVQY